MSMAQATTNLSLSSEEPKAQNKPQSHELLSKFLFDLQEEIEKRPEGMDYREYASRLWVRVGLSTEDPLYDQFERALIFNMKKIRMRDLVHPDLQDPDTFSQLFDLPGELLLWTKGDAENTGYQMVKFLRSGLRSKAVKTVLSKKKPRLKLADEAIVAQNKVLRLKDFLSRKLSEGKHYTKIVVLEDSVSAFGEVQRVAKELGMDIPVLPVWFAGTRVGTHMQKTDPEKYKTTFEKYHGVLGFQELLSAEMNEYLQPDDDTLWVNDFDGVNTDNRGMRERQFEAKVQALTQFTPYKTEEELWEAISKRS